MKFRKPFDFEGDFNSRPHGGRQSTENNFFTSDIFQLTPSRRATGMLRKGIAGRSISTHALTEGDFIQSEPCRMEPIFQLTPSRRATMVSKSSYRRKWDFNSRPHGGRPSTYRFVAQLDRFQLTPSRRATQIPIHFDGEIGFQLTPSRRATILLGFPAFSISISTHALTEGDALFWLTEPQKKYFNSRPHGGRRHCQGGT